MDQDRSYGHDWCNGRYEPVTPAIGPMRYVEHTLAVENYLTEWKGSVSRKGAGRSPAKMIRPSPPPPMIDSPVIWWICQLCGRHVDAPRAMPPRACPTYNYYTVFDKEKNDWTTDRFDWCEGTFRPRLDSDASVATVVMDTVQFGRFLSWEKAPSATD
jgi:hypothetical protein